MNKALEDLLAEEAQRNAAQTVADTDGLGSVAVLARHLVDLQTQKAELEKVINELNSRINKLETDALPAALDKVGLQNFTLNDGTKVELKDVVRAGLPNKDKHPQERQLALEWLVEHEHGGLIKRTLEFFLDKGFDAIALQKIIDTAANLGVKDVALDETVHTQTLAAFVREQLARGEALPASLFGVYVGRTIKVTGPEEAGTTTKQRKKR